VRSSLFFFLQIIPALLSAQSTEVTFRGFDVQGKGGEHANVIFEDRYGFIWFGKVNGLYKYDGYTLTHYQHEADDSTSLSNSYVTAIDEDYEGFLWVGTQDGLNKFNPATGKCRRFKHDPTKRASLSHNHITAICFDRSGAMWVGTSGGGLNVTERGATEKTDHNDFHFEHYRHDPGNPNSLSDDGVSCLAEDIRSNGEIFWIGTAHGLNAFYPQTQTFTRHLHDPNDARSLPYDQVWSLCQDREGDLWIGAGSGGLAKLNRNNSAEFRFTHFDLGKNVQVSTITEDRSGNLWIGTYHHCLFKFDTKTEELTHFKDDPNAINSFRSVLIHAVMIDRAGSLWVSCQSGIYKYDTQKEKLRQYAIGSSIPYTPGYRKISAICEDRENNLWLGAWDEGLAKFDLYTEQFKIYSPSGKNHKTLRSPWITAIHEDRSGLLWIGTVDGLECFDPKSEVFRHYGHNPADPNDPAKLSSDYISTIYKDSQGDLWIGTSRGLDKFNPRTGAFRHYLTDADNHISRIGYYVSAIYEDDSGNLLIGGKGLFRLNHNTGELARYFHHPNDSTGWIGDLIDCIHRDAGGGLWIATEGNGLFRLQKDRSPLHLTEANGLPSNLVFGILEDAQGALWISTFKGLVSLNPDSNSIKRHAVADDWRSNEFRAGIFHKGRSGRFYFGNLRGFVTVLPRFMRDNPYVPPVRITAFKIFNQPVIFDRPFSKLDQIRLTYEQNMFSFDFVALNYTKSDKNQHAYKMEGFHKDWIHCGNERTALFMNLDPGTYVFKVKASNNDGLWNEEGASIKVIITPPWWKTWWAYALYITFLALTLYALRLYDLRRQRLKHQLELEHIHAEKLEELDRVKSHFFANISHEFRTPLTLILGPLEKLIAEARQIDLKQQYQIMRRNAQHLLNLINQLLDVSKLESGSMTLRASCQDIVSLLRRIVNSFISLAERKQITLAFKPAEETILAYVDQDKLEKIVNNLLSNAFKFTPERGKVEVAVKKISDLGLRIAGLGMNQSSEIRNPKSEIASKGRELVEISIKDTGIGITADRIDKVFDRFYQVDTSQTRSYGGTGIGLALAKELVELHHGEIFVASEKGMGTTFIVRLPLGKALLAPEEIVETPSLESEPEEPSAEWEEIIASETRTEAQRPQRVKSAPILLIVEDNQDMRAYLCSLLSLASRVIESLDGQDGLEKALRVIPDLIISDVMMPRMDGFALCARLKTDERTSHIPVILLTARASAESKIAGLETGADDYIAKPFAARELQARVKNLIEQRRKLRERFRKEAALQPHVMAVTSTDEKFLQKALAVVEARMSDEDFSVEIFGREVGMSRVQLHRKLRALTDHSASEFIRTLRLHRAAQLLVQHGGNVTEVAYEVGFNNLSYFAKCFHQQFGVSPSAYAAVSSKTTSEE
jgi:signal transduction histidine kinase/ligand-binding sensor domain-containing protein/DNA-binding response OmpR family regulator